MVRLTRQHLPESLCGAARVSCLEIQASQMKMSVRIAGLQGESPFQVVACLGILTQMNVGNAETQLQFPPVDSQLPGPSKTVQSLGVVPQDGVADPCLVVGLRIRIGAPERCFQIGQSPHIVFADGDLA